MNDLDELIAEVRRRAGAGSALDALAAAAGLADELQRLSDDVLRHFVEQARAAKVSWDAIGSALGVSRQAVQQRFSSSPESYAPLAVDDEARRAFEEAKRAAVRYRHNYIGTEHLLLGLLAFDNAATHALARRGVDRHDIAATVDANVSMGSSRAVERIPLTPYAKTACEIGARAAAQAGRPLGATTMLAGIIGLGRGLAFDTLMSLGVDASALEGAE